MSKRERASVHTAHASCLRHHPPWSSPTYHHWKWSSGARRHRSFESRDSSPALSLSLSLRAGSLRKKGKDNRHGNQTLVARVIIHSSFIFMQGCFPWAASAGQPGPLVLLGYLLRFELLWAGWLARHGLSCGGNSVGESG